MSVPERPDENVEWAESPHAEVEEPEELRLYGWPFGFVPPSAAFNWLQRSVGRWIQWLEAKVDGHVHDGGSDPGSVAKVDVKEHLGWGQRGFFEVTSDTPDVHRVEHRHKNGNPAVAELSSDILQARRLLHFPGGTVRQIPLSDDVEVELGAQNAKLTFTQDIEVPNAEISGDIEIGGHAEISGALTADKIVNDFVPISVLRIYGSNLNYDYSGEDVVEAIRRDQNALDGAYRIIFKGGARYRILANLHSVSSSGNNGVGLETGFAEEPNEGIATATIKVFDADKNATTNDLLVFVYREFGWT